MESSVQNQPVKSKRGRPKGSKNKPKAPAPAETKAVAKPSDVQEHVRKINVLVEKVNQGEDKIEQYYRSIGQHIAAIKSAKPNDWLTIVDTECKLKKTRAYDLLAIANGTKTVEQVRGATALRVRESRKKEIPLRSGKDAPVEASPARTATGNGQVPIDMKERMAELDAKETVKEVEAAISVAEKGNQESHQAALYKQACKLVSTMNTTTRENFIAYLVGQYGQPTQ
jgi:hypothetical protein